MKRPSQPSDPPPRRTGPRRTNKYLQRQPPQFVEGPGRVHEPLRVHRDEVSRAPGGQAHLGSVDGAEVKHLPVRPEPAKQATDRRVCEKRNESAGHTR